MRSEEHTSELQSLRHLVCRLLLEKKKNKNTEQTQTQHHYTRLPTLHVAAQASRGVWGRPHAGAAGQHGLVVFCFFFFFFNDTATTEIYPLSLHDALPISWDFGARVRIAKPVCRRLGRSDRKSTRLNSSHLGISYAVFYLKKKKKQTNTQDNTTPHTQPTRPMNSQRTPHSAPDSLPGRRFAAASANALLPSFFFF